MALHPITSVVDGPRVTVNDLVKAPTVIPRRIIDMTANQFIADSLLRAGGSNFGVVEFYQSSPLFMDTDVAIKAEFGEYKIGVSSEGALQIALSVNRGLSVMVSEEMRRRNKIDRVNQQLTQIKNTMVRAWDNAVRDVITAGVGTFPASALWSTTTTDIRKDIVSAKLVVSEAVTGDQADNFLNFVPDTMVCSPATANLIVLNDSFGAVYRGNIADQSVLYRGKLPNQIVDLDVLVSRTWPDTEVLIAERKTLGFISDERPMQATPLYEHQPTETWRSDVSRISAIGLDQPLAAVRITGVAA